MTRVATTRDEQELDVSVVLAVYNESGHVLQEIERIRDGLDASAYSYEIIVVDDGSTDGSCELVSRTWTSGSSASPRTVGPAPPARPGRSPRAAPIVWTDVDMT